jgi:hypothetical protein
MFVFNNSKSVFFALVVAGAVGIGTGTAGAFDGVLTKTPDESGSYCHMKFPLSAQARWLRHIHS